MVTVEQAGDVRGLTPGILDRERIVARAGFNRWLVPPAALCIHLCIGMAYGFSVFWLPLSRALGVTKANACPDITLAQELFSTTCDWRVASMGWMYTLFFVVLGASAAIWGGWLERSGPRKAGVVAALCWCGGLVLGAIGIITHQLWILWLGSGVIGGVGLGLGYISPVSTLVKWFPDRRGMATGMAIMGFGGGAMIGAPLADLLMNFYKTPTSVGVWQTFLTMGAIYFVFMMIGAFGYRIPPAGWRPDSWTPPSETKTMITQHHVHLDNAHKTAQFWLIWAVLCLNVSAGIGVIGMASPMLQEIFAGNLIGQPGVSFTQLTPEQRTMVAAIAAGFTGLLSLFNIGGRFVWASLSDYLGPQEHLLHVLPARHRALCAGAVVRADPLQGAVRARVRHHPVDVWWRLRHCAGLSRRHLRHAVRRRDPRSAADGVVDCRHRRSGGGELHPRVRDRSRRSTRSRL